MQLSKLWSPKVVLLMKFMHEWPPPGSLVKIGKANFPGAVVGIRSDPSSKNFDEYVEVDTMVGIVLEDTSQSTRLVPVLVGDRQVWVNVQNLVICHN